MKKKFWEYIDRLIPSKKEDFITGLLSHSGCFIFVIGIIIGSGILLSQIPLLRKNHFDPNSSIKIVIRFRKIIKIEATTSVIIYGMAVFFIFFILFLIFVGVNYIDVSLNKLELGLSRIEKIGIFSSVTELIFCFILSILSIYLASVKRINPPNYDEDIKNIFKEKDKQ